MLFISNLYSSLLVTKLLFGEARRLKIGKPKKQNQVLQCLKKEKKPILNVTFLDIKGSNFI